MFLFDWIYDYMTTPALNRTPEIEALYYLSLLIIFGAIVGVVVLIAWVKWLIEVKIKKRK